MSQLDLLVSEPHALHERHVLIRHRDEDGLDHRLVGTAPLAPGQLLVLATPGAHTVPSLVDDLPDLLSGFMTGIDSVWIGVGRLAASTAAVARLAARLGAEVVAPDGGVAAMPGAALYAGRSAGGTGWYRFAPDGSPSSHGARFPLPSWESWVPAEPYEVSGVAVTPVPCGLLVSGSVEDAFTVPVNQRFPKIVLCGPLPAPSVVAELLALLPDKPVMVVPMVAQAADHVWHAELAVRLSRDVVFSTGAQVRTRAGAVATVLPSADGKPLFRPFPLAVRQSVRGGQQVLDVAAPPKGWERAGRTSYRPVDDSAVVADVVPSGLVVRAADDSPLDPLAQAAPFDPTGWTLALGTVGQPVGLPVLLAAERLLEALPARQRAAARVRMFGEPDEQAKRSLDRFARPQPPAPADPGAEPSRGGAPVAARSGSPRAAEAASTRSSAGAPTGRSAVPAAPSSAGLPVAHRVVPPAASGGPAADRPVGASAEPSAAPSAVSPTAVPAERPVRSSAGAPPVVASTGLPGADGASPTAVPAEWSVRSPAGAPPVVPSTGSAGGPSVVRSAAAVARPVAPLVAPLVGPPAGSSAAPAVAPAVAPSGVPSAGPSSVRSAGSVAESSAGAAPAGSSAVPPALSAGAAARPSDVPSAAEPVGPPVAPPVLPAGMPPIMTTSGAPVSTVSGAPTRVRPPEPADPAGGVEHAADPPLVADDPVAKDATPAQVPPDRDGSPESPRPSPDSHDRSPTPVPSRPGAAQPEPGSLVPGGSGIPVPPAPEQPAQPAQAAQPAPPAPGKPLVVPARDSSSGEQTRFTAAAGEYFAEALATVNAAMATWPSMRVDESSGVKADYVAVCLFLGRGAGGASAVNGALRVGQSGLLDGQIPCLMSGIRRLPTQRRAVLRQGKVAGSLEHRSTPGTILTEPGFLAASIDLDITVPGADLDVLIWPSSARRTSELMLGRPVDEAVFLAGARFKALAVRTAEENQDDDGEDDGSPTAPRIAVLYRELAPGETPSTTELDERDLAVLAKLDSVLARRHRGALRLVEDPEVIDRLTTSMVAWQQEQAAAVAS